jgi:hypothetical protein
MANALRHLAAIRSRLLSSPELTAIVARTPAPDSLPAIYLGHIFEVPEAEVVYPCVTLSQPDGNRAVWAPSLWDAARVQIDFFSKNNQFEPATMAELAEDLLHTDKTRTSTAEACFHEIREFFSNTSSWDGDTNAWRQTVIYLVRVSTH